MKKARTVVDIAMMIALPMLMAYSLIGDINHELLGVFMFLLFAAHHVMNRKWWGAIFKGRYSAARVFNTGIDLLLAVYMLMQPVSGILMSKHILTGVTIDGAASDLRTIHMSLAYWGFILLSMHLGLHAGQVIAKLRGKSADVSPKGPVVVASAVSAYGLYAFIRRGIADYLLLRVQFAYFDPSASVLLFLLDYASVMVLIASITCFIHKQMIGYRNKERA